MLLLAIMFSQKLIVLTNIFDMAKICLTTYIYGEEYQKYIPFLVYSCNKSYPEYDIKLFLHERLHPEIQQQLDLIGKNNLVITENVYADCPKMNSLKAKSLRWVLYDDVFLDYDYLYIVDIDMIYIREPLPLHEQHVQHMSTTGLPYDNIARHFYRHPFAISSIGQRYKLAGFTAFFQYFFGTRDDFRVSGLHFIDVRQYFDVLSESMREKYRKMIYNGRFMRLCLSSNNESFLYSILQKEGLKPDLLPVQTESYIMLDFNNPTRAEFRPHHGIHLGIFSEDLQSKGKRKTILDSSTYSYYIDHFKQDYLSDSLFVLLLNSSSDTIKIQFDNLFRYYKIPSCITKK